MGKTRRAKAAKSPSPSREPKESDLEKPSQRPPSASVQRSPLRGTRTKIAKASRSPSTKGTGNQKASEENRLDQRRIIIHEFRVNPSMTVEMLFKKLQPHCLTHEIDFLKQQYQLFETFKKLRKRNIMRCPDPMVEKLMTPGYDPDLDSDKYPSSSPKEISHDTIYCPEK